MGMNREMIGFAYPDSKPFVVTAESISNFARAIGDENPIYFDLASAVSAGHKTICAPPTFPIAVTMKVMEGSFHDPALNMDYSRIVHSDQRFEYHRPIQVGDELVVRAIVEDIRALGNNDIATFRTEVYSAGEPVVTAWSKLVVRGEDS
jgi:acyl dehydratase